VVAPVLGMVAVGVVVRVLCARRRQELAGSACREWYLDAAQADVEINVVFEDECRLQAGVEEPTK
jgi:hypothetical protein